MTDFTLTNLAELEDMAPKFDMGAFQEARFATRDLQCHQLGVAFLRVKPGQRVPFRHRHEQQEEVYVVLAGSGRALLDDEVQAVAPLDALRVGPSTARTFEADADGLELIAFGAPAVSAGRNDAVMIPPG